MKFAETLALARCQQISIYLLFLISFLVEVCARFDKMTDSQNDSIHSVTCAQSINYRFYCIQIYFFVRSIYDVLFNPFLTTIYYFNTKSKWKKEENENVCNNNKQTKKKLIKNDLKNATKKVSLYFY